MGSREEATEALGLKINTAYVWKRRMERGGWTGPSSGPTGSQTEDPFWTGPDSSPTGPTTEAPVSTAVRDR
jgi:hypothetical protein